MGQRIAAKTESSFKIIPAIRLLSIQAKSTPGLHFTLAPHPAKAEQFVLADKLRLVNVIMTEIFNAGAFARQAACWTRSGQT